MSAKNDLNFRELDDDSDFEDVSSMVLQADNAASDSDFKRQLHQYARDIINWLKLDFSSSWADSSSTDDDLDRRNLMYYYQDPYEFPEYPDDIPEDIRNMISPFLNIVKNSFIYSVIARLGDESVVPGFDSPVWLLLSDTRKKETGPHASSIHHLKKQYFSETNNRVWYIPIPYEGLGKQLTSKFKEYLAKSSREDVRSFWTELINANGFPNARLKTPENKPSFSINHKNTDVGQSGALTNTDPHNQLRELVKQCEEYRDKISPPFGNNLKPVIHPRDTGRKANKKRAARLEFKSRINAPILGLLQDAINTGELYGRSRSVSEQALQEAIAACNNAISAFNNSREEKINTAAKTIQHWVRSRKKIRDAKREAQRLEEIGALRIQKTFRRYMIAKLFKNMSALPNQPTLTAHEKNFIEQVSQFQMNPKRHMEQILRDYTRVSVAGGQNLSYFILYDNSRVEIDVTQATIEDSLENQKRFLRYVAKYRGEYYPSSVGKHLVMNKNQDLMWSQHPSSGEINIPFINSSGQLFTPVCIGVPQYISIFDPDKFLAADYPFISRLIQLKLNSAYPVDADPILMFVKELRKANTDDNILAKWSKMVNN